MTLILSKTLRFASSNRQSYLTSNRGKKLEQNLSTNKISGLIPT